jgi:acyl-coenzyme A synthetase/AMP-(fatty) acid ligase
MAAWLWGPDMRALLLSTLAALLTACASLGMMPADTFNKRALNAYATVQTLSESAAVLYASGKLSTQDRDKIVQTNREVLAGLEVAVLAAKTDLGAASTKLESTLLILTALESYLQTKQGAK